MFTKPIRTLKDLYNLMKETRDVRYKIVTSYDKNKKIKPSHVHFLETAMDSLVEVTENNYSGHLEIGKNKSIEVDFSYETKELIKDLLFLDGGEEKLINHFNKIHHDFDKHVNTASEKLKGIKFNNFITDRDGTINNYCARYQTSVQSIYNSIFLTNFARNRTNNSIIITSAPLSNPGIVDVSIDPPNTVIYAASKGREFIHSSGKRYTFPIKPEKQKKLTKLNEELSRILKKTQYQKFTLIGSGLQFKFGQTTIARQDICSSINPRQSDDFLKTIKTLVSTLDPQKKFFRIEDTGKDIEIILTIEDLNSENKLKDFDKGDGFRFINKTLKLGIERGPTLVCGDTSSDVSMVETAIVATQNTMAIFVTEDRSLCDKVSKVCPNAIFVPEPDILITILNQISKEEW